MNIKKCGKTNHREHREKLQRTQRKNKILKFLCVLCTTSVLSVFCFSFAIAETFYAAGRGTEEKGTIWKYTEGAWSVHSAIPDCSEIFSLVTDKNGSIFAGGNYFNYGTVWKYNGNEWDKGIKLPECRGLYTIAIDQKGNIWAGGTGTKNIWHYNGTQWDNGAKLQSCSGIYSIAVDSSGNIWAGGEGKNQIWRFNGTEWDKGTKLSDCTDIFSLYVDSSGVIWAGGRGGKVLWWYKPRPLSDQYSDTIKQSTGHETDSETMDVSKGRGKEAKWSLGTILLDSTEISAFTEDTNGQLYAAGAGRNKIWQKKTEIDWQGINLDGCIAAYSISSNKDTIICGGWNLERKGKFWKKHEDNWDMGANIEKSYVVRSIAVIKK